MATPEEVRLLLDLSDDKPLKEHLIQQLAARENAAGSIVRCEWCGKEYTKKRRKQVFCEPKCRDEFHYYAKRFIKERDEG